MSTRYSLQTKDDVCQVVCKCRLQEVGIRISISSMWFPGQQANGAAHLHHTSFLYDKPQVRHPLHTTPWVPAAH